MLELNFLRYSNLKRKCYIVDFNTSVGERQPMFEDKFKNTNMPNFGRLELVDKDLFFISFNRRDN